MNNKTIAIIAISIVVAGGIYAYSTKFWKKSEDIFFTKSAAIDIITQDGKHADKVFLSSLDDEFLKSWANAVYRKNQNFTYNGRIYSTLGGKTIKK